jgi:hypothetical protein
MPTIRSVPEYVASTMQLFVASVLRNRIAYAFVVSIPPRSTEVADVAMLCVRCVWLRGVVEGVLATFDVDADVTVDPLAEAVRLDWKVTVISGI